MTNKEPPQSKDDQMDFDEILKAFKWEGTKEDIIIVRDSEADKTILFALALASKIQAGVVTHEMQLIGNDLWNEQVFPDEIYRTMCAELIKQTKEELDELFNKALKNIAKSKAK